MQRFLVTGANKGIGLAVVKGLLDASKVAFVFLGSRDAGRGNDAVQSIITANPELYSGRVEALEIDVSDAGSVSRAADAVRTRLGSDPENPSYLDALVNNAGVAAEEFSPAAFKTCLDVNFSGVVRTTEAFLPFINPSKGRIVMVSSGLGPSFVARCSAERKAVMVDPLVTHAQITGLVAECLAIAHSGGHGHDDVQRMFAAAGLSGAHSRGGYGLSKALVNMYTMQLARENPNLLVNSCTPGFVKTDMTRALEVSFGGTLEQLGAGEISEGADVLLYLTIGEITSTGWYFETNKRRASLGR